VIVPKDLTLEAGELTPTMKVIRHRVLEKYSDWVDAIYRPANHPDKQGCTVSIQ
jgi:long-subunit acyl-CoA synthetase (AMP-forming)